MKFFAFALFATAVSAQCCDPMHNGYEMAAANVAVCTAHGGIPISEPIADQTGHTFNILKQCAFPYDPRITVERK